MNTHFSGIEMKSVKLCAVIALSQLLPACVMTKAAYVAPGAVYGQQARILSEPVCQPDSFGSGPVEIIRIDGLKTAQMLSIPNPVSYVPPGEHKFTIFHAVGTLNFTGHLKLNAQANTSYVLHCAGAGSRFWFTEGENGPAVGSIDF
ncbi:hypothetical protein [Dyella sp. S184]|jgi:hypothetical protein|uniref:hypothetical protein n=1 Tax=Dyella sp. S184 TaxID=1641862 RepID=UPI00131E0CE2|nr:hypothetical protein [Dyella sp. S184]